MRRWGAISDASGSADKGEGTDTDSNTQIPPADGDASPSPTGTDRFQQLRYYWRRNRVHLAVVTLFAIYPPVYTLLISSPLGAEFQLLMPKITAMTVVLYLGLFAISFDFISGYTGYLSFGHAAFFGIGAYAVVLATQGKIPLVPTGTPFMFLLVLAAVLAAIGAVLIGLVSFRLTGVYFAMITLGFAQLGYELIRNWNYVSSNPRDGATVAGDGLAIGVPYVDAVSLRVGRLAGDSFTNVLGLGFDISATVISYYMLGIVVVICYYMMRRILNSPFGSVMVAIRENEERAQAIGYNTYWYKLGAFTLSAFFAGIAGAIFAAYARSVSPESTFHFLVTADALIAAIVGGFGTLAGPLLGDLIVRILEEILSTEAGALAWYLRNVLGANILSLGVGGVTVGGFIESVIAGRAPLYVGIIFILFVLYVPNGVLGTLYTRLGGSAEEKLPAAMRRYFR